MQLPNEQTIEILSIAFGAPFICSRNYAAQVNTNDSQLKCHFFNFVHKSDPIFLIVDGREDQDDGDSVDEAGTSAGYWNVVDPEQYDSKQHRQRKFFPIGQTAFLETSKRYRSKEFSFHDDYKSALSIGRLLVSSISTISASDQGQELVLRVTTPAPEVCVNFLPQKCPI